MTKGRTSKDYSPPKLVVPREDAVRRIKERLELGRNLRDQKMFSMADLDSALEKRAKWLENNVETLARLVNNPLLEDEYNIRATLDLDSAITFSLKEKYYRDDMNEQIGKLESFLEHLKLIPEITAEEIVEQKLSEESVKQEQPKEIESIEAQLREALTTELKSPKELRLKIPVSMEHDAKAAGLGEFYYGAGRDERSMVFTVIGTGVGAAIILDGQLIRGVKNFAGEVGHATVDRNGESCPCGSRGCLDTYISGPWLARRYLRLQEQEKKAISPPATPLTGETVARLARDGDPLAMEIMTEAGEALGIAVATMAMILDIELYVFGGSVPKCGDLLLEPARRIVPRYSFRTVGPHVRLVVSERGDDGPILGCGWLARQTLEKSNR